MGTKQHPGEFDCHEKALPDEPLFTLLARDKDAPALLRYWSDLREKRIIAGHAPSSDYKMVHEALKCANEMEAWRAANYGVWWK